MAEPRSCHLLDIGKVFHKIYPSRPTDSSLLRPRPFFSLRAGFMAHQVDVARSRDIVTRWRDLAEQRLEYLTELFETGRWRRYHSELAFLENIQEAKNAVETWRDLSMREDSPYKSAKSNNRGGANQVDPAWRDVESLDLRALIRWPQGRECHRVDNQRACGIAGI